MNIIRKNILGMHSILRSSLCVQNFTKGKPHEINKVLLCGCVQRAMSSVPTRFLDLGSGRKIAYKFREGNPKKPTVVFSPGLMQTMEDVKPVAIDELCKANEVNFVRFDYEGLGESSGSLEKAYFGQWIEDLQNVVDKVCKTPVVLVGFSMGGWISTVVALRRPERLHSLLYVAPGFNFLEHYYDIFYEKLSPEQKKDLDDGKCIYFNDLFMRKDFAKESLKYHIDFEQPIPIDVPIRIIHGMKDRDAPYQISMEILALFESMDVDIYLKKSGKHHLVEPTDMALLISTLKNLIQDYPIKN